MASKEKIFKYWKCTFCGTEYSTGSPRFTKLMVENMGHVCSLVKFEEVRKVNVTKREMRIDYIISRLYFQDDQTIKNIYKKMGGEDD